MNLKLITPISLLMAGLSFVVQIQAQNQPKWPTLALLTSNSLKQKCTDSIAYYRPKCDSIRSLMHDLALSTGLDNAFMFGSELEFLREGLSKEFRQKPVIPSYLKPGKNNKMAQVTVLHVSLFDLDVHLSYWADVQMILAQLSKQDLIDILQSGFDELSEEEQKLITGQDQLHWSVKTIQQYLDYELRNSPYFLAFHGEGYLNNDAYKEDLIRFHKLKNPVKNQPEKWIRQFKWMVPPVLNEVKDFVVSVVKGDTLIAILNEEHSGVVDKEGRVVVPFEYERIDFFYSDWISASKDKTTYWYNRKGETFLQGYDRTYPHLWGHALVQKEKKWGVFDSNGKLLVPLAYDRYTFSRSKDVYIFYQGKDSIIYKPNIPPAIIPTAYSKPKPLVIPQRIQALKFDQVQLFDPGRFWYSVRKDRLEGLVDSLGQEILPIAHSFISRRGSDLIIFEKDKKAGYWIISKNIKVEPKYRRIQIVEDSSKIAIVGIGLENGILDLETEKFLMPYSKYSIDYRKPYFLLKMKYDTTMDNFTNMNGYLHGLANEKGQIIEKPDSVDILTFFNGNYLITPHYNKSAKHALLKSAKGRVLRRFDKSITTKGAWIRYYDEHFDVKWVSYRNYRPSDVCDEVSSLSEELYMVKQNGLWGYTNRRGEEVFPVGFSEAQASKNGLVRVKVNGKWGLLKNPLYKANQR